jgi:hypothetical protein
MENGNSDWSFPCDNYQRIGAFSIQDYFENRDDEVHRTVMIRLRAFEPQSTNGVLLINQVGQQR